MLEVQVSKESQETEIEIRLINTRAKIIQNLTREIVNEENIFYQRINTELKRFEDASPKDKYLLNFELEFNFVKLLGDLLMQKGLSYVKTMAQLISEVNSKLQYINYHSPTQKIKISELVKPHVYFLAYLLVAHDVESKYHKQLVYLFLNGSDSVINKFLDNPKEDVIPLLEKILLKFQMELFKNGLSIKL